MFLLSSFTHRDATQTIVIIIRLDYSNSSSSGASPDLQGAHNASESVRAGGDAEHTKYSNQLEV